MHKRLGIIILTTLILLLTCSTAALAAGDISLEQARDEIVSYYENNKPTLDNWEEVVGLSRAGVDFSVEPWQLPDWKVDEIGPTSPPSDYARTIIGMLAASHNPRDASGRDLVNELVYRQADSGEFGIGGVFINTVWSMIALDTAGADYNAEKAVESLLANQTSDGGFSFNSTSSADADLTGFALMALAPYKELSEVNSAINEAQECLKNMQLGDSAGFASWGSANCNSTSAVIRGLVACGIDITTEEWQKSGRTMIDALFDFQLDNKSFCYTQGGSSNAMATQQALIAVADLVKAAVDYNLGQGGNSNPGQDEKTRIRVRVEGATQSLADETVTVAGTALDALKAAVGEENVTAPGGFITNIMGESGRNEVAENTDTSWCYYVIRDGAPEMTAFDEGAGSFNVKDGDEVVFYIGAYDNISYASRTYLPIVTVTPASPTAGQTITLNITAQKYVWGEGLQALSAEEVAAIGDYTVEIGETEYPSFYGQVTIPNVTQGTLNFTVTNVNEAGYPDIVSFKGNITVGEGANAQVRVRVEGAASSLHDSTVTVTGTALDALKAAVGEENVAAPGGFITDIMGEHGQNVAENTDTSWCYYVIRDGMPEMTTFDEGAGSFNVKDGDEVVFYIGAYDNISYASKTYLPIVTVTPASPTAGQTITVNITAQKYVWGEGLQPLNAEEITAIGDYKVIVEEQEYISQSGQVAISDITQGTLDFIVTNFNEAGYPDVVSFKGSITVDSSGNEGNGGSTHKDEVTVEIAVVGKNNNLIFGPGSVTVSESDSYGITAMSALCKTGLSWGFSPDWDGLVTMIDGISNEGMNGWMYKVNHEAPMVVPRDKKVARGDQIIFWYSSDAMSNGPDWGDLGRGPSPGTGSGTGKADAQTLDSVKESLESYSKQLANMKAQNQILNAEKKMTAEKVQDLKKELDSNTFSLSQEVGQEETVLADAKTEVSLLVPADALSQATTLTIEKRSSSSAPASPNVRIASSIYEFGPSGTKFDQMVTISLKVAITEDIDTANLTAAWYDEEKEKWANIPGIIDLKEGLVVFQIDHFSQFAVIELVPNKTEILPPELRKTFLDVDEKLAWARDAIEILAGQGIIRGTGKGFEPQRPITRAEFVKLVVTALDLEAEPYTNGRFSDVQSSDWFADAVGCACKHNIIVGYADGTFKPGHNITRNEIAAIFYRLEEASDDDPENSVLIKDIDTIPAWALDAVKYVTAQGLMQGYEDQTFRGNRPITRAEAAVVIFRYLEK
ncbi:MAG: S-layer homology domain-containing protein [Syntrophothermaceae bacterium]